MQTFIDTVTGQAWQFDADVVVTQQAGAYVFTAPHGAKLNVPTTLMPGELPPPVVPSLSDRQAKKWNDIRAERERRTRTGGYLVGAKWFHSDPDSRIQQIGLVMMGASIPAGLQWKTMDGSFITMTPTLAAQVFAAAAASDQAIFAKAEEHNAAMLQSETPETYDHLGGWPKVYGE